MHRFEIYNHNILIGWSELEAGDPPMGVAFGNFLPSPKYKEIQSTIIEGSEKNHGHLNLSIRLANTGEILQLSGGVHITDYSADLGEDGIQVEALGIAYPLYEKLFSEHVTAYADQFPGNG